MELDKLNYVDEAEKVIKSLVKQGRNGKTIIELSNTKVRNLLGMVSPIYNTVVRQMDAKLSEDIQSQIRYVKMRFAYEAGRDLKVKEFVEKAHIFQIIDSIGDSREQFILFCCYMEALVAYHKYNGGRD